MSASGQRKKKEEEASIEVDLDNKEIDWLEGAARKLGMTFEALINRIIRDALEKLKKETTKTTKRKTR